MEKRQVFIGQNFEFPKFQLRELDEKKVWTTVSYLLKCKKKQKQICYET